MMENQNQQQLTDEQAQALITAWETWKEGFRQLIEHVGRMFADWWRQVRYLFEPLPAVADERERRMRLAAARQRARRSTQVKRNRQKRVR